MTTERSYVIGTHDAEIERLGVQHRVWRASVLDFWRSGGITVIDAGAGPGYATLDLAEIVGPTGRVIALERSRRSPAGTCSQPPKRPACPRHHARRIAHRGAQAVTRLSA